jgi:hypothetical protein
LTLLASCGVASGQGSDRAAATADAQSETSVSQGVEVEGQLIDVMSNRALAVASIGLLHLESQALSSTKVAADGRFHFGSVRPGKYVLVIPQTDGSWEHVMSVAPIEYVPVEVKTSSLRLDRVRVLVQSGVERDYAHVCAPNEKKFRLDPAIRVLVFHRAGSNASSWRLSTRETNSVWAEWTHSWRGVVCLQDDDTTANYGERPRSTANVPVGVRNWRVKVVRENGRVFTGVAKGRPPETISALDMPRTVGDPLPDLLRQIRSLPK